MYNRRHSPLPLPPSFPESPRPQGPAEAPPRRAAGPRSPFHPNGLITDSRWPYPRRITVRRIGLTDTVQIPDIPEDLP
ncbi:unnamed protein product [Lota lota]